MIIEIDVGNTRLKWRAVCSAVDTSEARFFSHSDVQSVSTQLLAELSGARMIKVSSVADSLKPALQKVAVELGADIEFAKTEAECAGVTNSYSNPAAMGVDRWLAMLAAFNSHADKQPCVVIDSGTSLTIDFIAGTGQHLGGLILPGRQLLLESLARNTEKVLFDPELSSGEMALGQSTQDAVLNGSVHMMVGAINQAIETAGLHIEDCRYFLSGGDAELLQRHLCLQTKVVPDLVLDGLCYSLP